MCAGCGLALPSHDLPPDSRYNASGECRSHYERLLYWTLAQTDARFIHQYAVDAYAAQHVRSEGPAVSAAFALVGLYLAVEKRWTGRQVQRTHSLLAGRSKQWPRFVPRASAGGMTVADVLTVEAGPAREDALLRWCHSVWSAWEPDHERVRKLIDRIR